MADVRAALAVGGRVVSIVVVAWLVGGCSNDPVRSPVASGEQNLSTATPAWGAEAVDFFDAHALGICERDEYDVVRFYAADAVVDYRAMTLGPFPGQLRQGRDAVVSFLDLCLFDDDSQIWIDVDDVFLHPEGATTIERWTGIGPGPGLVASHSTIGVDGIESMRYFAPVGPQTIPKLDLEEIVGGDVSDVFGFPTTWGWVTELVVLSTGRDECANRSASWLVLDDGVFVVERVDVNVVSARRCATEGDLPSGWWTGRSVPLPLDERLTGVVSFGAGSADVYNADRAAIDLLFWAEDRFQGVGLEPPLVDAVVFGPSRACGDLAGLAEVNAAGTRIHLCIDQIACPAGACRQFTLAAKISLLHELGHLWLRANTDDALRREFVALTGTETWAGEKAEWANRGVEWAAETIAWGLVDEPAHLIRLGLPPCSLLRESFELLTGVSPHQQC